MNQVPDAALRVKRMIEIRLENTARTAVQDELASAGGAAAATKKPTKEALVRGAAAAPSPYQPPPLPCPHDASSFAMSQRRSTANRPTPTNVRSPLW